MSKQAELARKVAKHLRLKEAGKKKYKEAEALLDEIVELAKPGQEVKLAGGRIARVKDLYLETNKVYRAHGIGRYEVEVSEG